MTVLAKKVALLHFLNQLVPSAVHTLGDAEGFIRWVSVVEVKRRDASAVPTSTTCSPEQSCQLLFSRETLLGLPFGAALSTTPNIPVSHCLVLLAFEKNETVLGAFSILHVL